jgi:hypothetical protein
MYSGSNWSTFHVRLLQPSTGPWNVGQFLPNYTAKHPWSQSYSYWTLREPEMSPVCYCLFAILIPSNSFSTCVVTHTEYSYRVNIWVQGANFVCEEPVIVGGMLKKGILELDLIYVALWSTGLNDIRSWNEDARTEFCAEEAYKYKCMSQAHKPRRYIWCN